MTLELMDKLERFDMSWAFIDRDGVYTKKRGKKCTVAISPDKYYFVEGTRSRGVRIVGLGYYVPSSNMMETPLTWHSERCFERIKWNTAKTGEAKGCRGASVPHYDHDVALIKKKKGSRK